MPMDFDRYQKRPPLRVRMRQGDLLLGSFLFLPSPTVVEILAEAGLDFVILDLEHSPKNWETVENMVRAADIYGMPTLIRVPENNAATILHSLEVGAAGVVLPFIETADDVKKAASALRYAPAGKRGTCTQSRSARHGALRANFQDLTRIRNSEAVLLGLIESRRGVENVTDMLDVEDGLDAIVVGRSDLASSMGKPGQVDAPEVQAATDSVLSTIAEREKGAARSAVVVYDPKESSDWRRQGCSIFINPSEAGLLLSSMQSWRHKVHEATNNRLQEVSENKK